MPGCRAAAQRSCMPLGRHARLAALLQRVPVDGGARRRPARAHDSGGARGGESCKTEGTQQSQAAGSRQRKSRSQSGNVKPSPKEYHETKEVSNLKVMLVITGKVKDLGKRMEEEIMTAKAAKLIVANGGIR